MAIRIESGTEPIPGYKLLERLGGGGFGEVWKAEAPGGLLKAIKFVHGNLQGVGEEEVRAKQELKALNRVKTVRHPYVLSLERFDIIEGQLVIVMELADRNLWDRFQECRAQGLPGIPREELLGYMAESAEALDLMNQEHNLQHLDIKPQNLFLVYNHIKVADFGLVKDLEGVRAQVTGGVTPVYAAPETFDGEVSKYCDQYSLAIVYQELLTGQRPFKGASVQQLIMQHLTGRPNLTPLPLGDREPVARALAKKPEERFPSCAELALALRRGGMAAPAKAPAASASSSRVGIQTEARPVPPADGKRALAPPPGPPVGPGRSTAGLPRPAVGPPPLTPRGRAEQEPTVQGEEGPPFPPPRPEVKGNGVLFPALVIAIGHLGLGVLRQVRRGLTEQVGSVECVPNIRFLYLDTDPEVGQAAKQDGPGLPLDPGEVLLARLNRASHYQKATPGRPRLESWFDTKMLYRIPRNLVTTGLRALGRLAFVDNYRIIAQKVRSELEACTDAAALTKAAQQTQLGQRSNWPRVYVVTSLAGGTGSGMFLDLAYVVRWHLKQLGYAQPDVIGLFLVPESSRDAARTMALGNAYAALTELNHFAWPNNCFTARYDDKDGTLRDSDRPFRQCVLLPLPSETSDGAAARELAGFAADYLCRDLVSWLGRKADEARAKLPPPQTDPALLHWQAFGLYRYFWPRRVLVERSARELCHRLVEGWMSRESGHLRTHIQAWVDDQWAQLALGPEHVIERLGKAAERSLGQAAETAFTAANAAVEAGSKPVSSLWGRRIPDLSPAVVIDALARMEQLVGRPEGTVGPRRPATLTDALPRAGDELAGEWQKKLTHLADQLIELPESRLAGAEEAIRQIGAKVEQVLQSYETLCQELAARADHAYARIYAHASNLQATGGKRSAPEATELLEMLRAFPRCRYQSLMLRQVIGLFTGLRDQLADQLREVEFCRQRLGELRGLFEEAPAGSSSGDGVPGQRLLPSGCKGVGDAVKQVVGRVTTEDVHALDERVQAMIRQQFTALSHVCQATASVLKNLETAMVREAEPFAEARLAGSNVVEMFLERYPQEQEAMDDLSRAFDEAAPHLGGARVGRPPEVQVLAAPPGPSEERFRDLAGRAVPEAKFVAAASSDDIVLYRELPNLPVTALEQLGPAGLEAYRQMTTVENFTPHSRTDIAEWQPLPAR